MDQNQFNYVAERVDILADASSSTQVTKDAAIAWREAVAADASDENVAAATEQLLDILEGRPSLIDGTIAFAEGPAKEVFGEEAAAQMLAAAREHKAQGGKFCICEACTAASEILAEFGRVEL